MLTYNELRVIYKVINFTCSTFCIPCDFSCNHSRMELNIQAAKSKLKFRICILWTLLSTLYQCFHGFRLYESYRLKDFERNPAQSALSIIFLIARSFSIFNFMFIVKRHELAQFLNHQSQLNSRIGKLAIY